MDHVLFGKTKTLIRKGHCHIEKFRHALQSVTNIINRFINYLKDD